MPNALSLGFIGAHIDLAARDVNVRAMLLACSESMSASGELRRERGEVLRLRVNLPSFVRSRLRRSRSASLGIESEEQGQPLEGVRGGIQCLDEHAEVTGTTAEAS